MSDLSGTARQATEAARDVAGQAQQKGEELYRRGAHEAEKQAARLADVIKDQPLLSAAVAVALGYLLGRLTMGSRR